MATKHCIWLQYIVFKYILHGIIVLLLRLDVLSCNFHKYIRCRKRYIVRRKIYLLNFAFLYSSFDYSPLTLLLLFGYFISLSAIPHYSYFGFKNLFKFYYSLISCYKISLRHFIKNIYPVMFCVLFLFVIGCRFVAALNLSQAYNSLANIAIRLI